MRPGTRVVRAIQFLRLPSKGRLFSWLVVSHQLFGIAYTRGIQLNCVGGQKNFFSTTGGHDNLETRKSTVTKLR